MGPQQSSSPRLPFFFQSRLPLRRAASVLLCQDVWHVFSAAERSWRRQKLSGGGVRLRVGVFYL
jgi:hypothetical protein